MKTFKIQKLFGDVVYDLRNRGLLPLAALLIVCIVVAPVVISLMGSDSPTSPPADPAAASAAELAPENQAAVLAYNPGVRDYKKRLGNLAEKDPFRQQFTVSAAATSALGEASSAGDAGTTTDTTGGGGGTGGATGTGEVTPGGSGGSGGSGGKVNTRYYFYETDVIVGEAGGNLQRRNRIDVFSPLPNEGAPVMFFMGNAKQGKSVVAIFSVARDVIELSGGGDCFPSPDSCQLLVLKPGEAEDLVYGPDGKTYRIKVLTIDLKVTKKPPQG